ncbi:hypothetical protein ABPG72_016182 [Tetrahymena utriculariae]
MKTSSSLQKLKIQFHNQTPYCVDDFGSSNLAVCVSKLNNLLTFQLNICNVDFFDSDLSSILDGLSKCESLEILNSCAIEANLSSGFQKIKNLKRLILNLGDNFVVDLGASTLGSQLSKCLKLQTLKLQLLQNRIGYEGDIKLAQQLTNCDQLTTLTIQLSLQYKFQNYKGMFMEDLIRGLKYLKNLFTIDFEFTFNYVFKIVFVILNQKSQRTGYYKISLMKLRYLVSFNNNTD